MNRLYRKITNIPRSFVYRVASLQRRWDREKRLRQLRPLFNGRWPSDLSMNLLETLLCAKANLSAFPTVLIDVGAFQGEFSRGFASVFPETRIACFEPNPFWATRLADTLASLSPLIVNKAVSDINSAGRMFFIHDDASMSSLLPCDPECLATKFPGDQPDKLKLITVPVVTLDDCQELQWLLGKDDSIFIKIDVQGNDLAVLKGALRTLERTTGVLVEHMFCTPYIGSYVFEELVAFMWGRGFRCRGPQNVRRRPNCEVSGVDFLFTR